MKKRQEVYDLYWYFACERQNIFWKKINGESAPWTEDKILQEYKFCNSYRVNDRVSQYLLKNVIYNGKKYSDEDMLFRILLFKLFNEESTWELLLNNFIDITLKTFNVKEYSRVLENAISSMKQKDVILMENTRFEDVPGKKESKNDPELGKYWASLGDVFVNDAFGTAHREHASNVGIASNIKEVVAGFLMEKEIKFIGEAVDNPEKPFVAILGGAKVSDKISVIENLINKADKILICGAMAYTFFSAQGYEIGTSKCEKDYVNYAKELLAKAKGKIILPVDNVVAKEFSETAESQIVLTKDLPVDQMGLDIGPETIKLFERELQGAKTVVWNGPAGVFEFKKFAVGTNAICKILAELENATTIIGGGDSAAAAIQMGYEDKFTHISTGGGASLEYLEGKELPGIASINNK